MKFGIPDDDLSEIINHIKDHFGTTINPQIFIYGSRVKGNAREFSDIDILLKASSYDKESLSHLDFTNLDTVYKVDFVLDSELFDQYRDEIYEHMVEVL